MKRAILITLIVFTLSLFPSFAQDADSPEEPPVTESVESEDTNTEVTVTVEVTEIKLIYPIRLPGFGIALQSAFCGHGC